MARPKSGFLKAFGKSFEIFKLIADAVLDLGGSDEDLLALLKDKERVRKIGAIIVDRPRVETDYFTPIYDTDVPERHQATLAKYRQLAREHYVPDAVAVCYRVRKGFTLKAHAPKFGPCYEQFGYLQGWNFPDEPTSDSLVFWVPRLLKGSTAKTKDEQVTFLAGTRKRFGLPGSHLSGFGEVGLVAGLILAHHKATGERVPLDCYWIRTDTCVTDGYRLLLGLFDEAGLYCACWDWDDDRGDDLGVFALGVEALGD